MTHGRKTGGRNFKKGNTYGKAGRPVGSVSIPTEIKKLNKAMVEDILSKYLKLPVLDLKTASEDPDTPALDMMIIGIIVKAIHKGDFTRLNGLLDRTIGRTGLAEDEKVVNAEDKLVIDYGGN